MNRLALSKSEMAQNLSVSERTLFDWTNDPDDPIPSFRRGNRVLYPVAPAERWLERQCKQQNKDGNNGST